MFGIGFPEMIVILVLIVLVVGPEQLPDVVRKGVAFLREAKKHVAEIKSEIDKQTAPIQQSLDDMITQEDDQSEHDGTEKKRVGNQKSE